VYPLQNISVKNSGRMRRVCISCFEESRNEYILIGRPQGKKPRKPRIKWNDIIKIHLAEIRYEGVDWIQLAQDRVQWRTVVNTILIHKIQ
jgi:hypothetical protein